MPENTDYAQLAAYRAWLSTCCQETLARQRIAHRLGDKFQIISIVQRHSGWRVHITWRKNPPTDTTLMRWCNQRGYRLVGQGLDVVRGEYYVDVQEVLDV